MHVLLRVNTANKPEKKIKVSRDVLIGRERGRCDLRVASSEVSRRHCQILVGEKTVDVRDLGSANGTRVNGELIPAKINFPVDSGDLVTIGPLEINVEFRGGRKRSRPTAKTEDEFLSQDSALAALDAPGADLEHSAPEILIENRLVDNDDDYGSNLETIDAADIGESEFSEIESFEGSASSDDVAPEQISPLVEEDVVEDLELLETLDPADNDTPLAEAAPAEAMPFEQPLPLEAVSNEADSNEADPNEADPNEADPNEAEPNEAEPRSVDTQSADAKGQKTGRLKSLFGRLGRKKVAGESSSELIAEETAPTGQGLSPDPNPVPETLTASESPETPPEAEPSVDLVIPEGGELWEPPEGEWEPDDDDELVSVEDAGSVDEALAENFDDVEELVELEEDDEDAPPVDEGFADFLNELDEPR